jgi:hypothetical protein
MLTPGGPRTDSDYWNDLVDVTEKEDFFEALRTTYLVTEKPKQKSAPTLATKQEKLFNSPTESTETATAFTITAKRGRIRKTTANEKKETKKKNDNAPEPSEKRRLSQQISAKTNPNSNAAAINLSLSPGLVLLHRNTQPRIQLRRRRRSC